MLQLKTHNRVVPQPRMEDIVSLAKYVVLTVVMMVSAGSALGISMDATAPDETQTSSATEPTPAPGQTVLELETASAAAAIVSAAPRPDASRPVVELTVPVPPAVHQPSAPSQLLMIAAPASPSERVAVALRPVAAGASVLLSENASDATGEDSLPASTQPLPNPEQATLVAAEIATPVSKNPTEASASASPAELIPQQNEAQSVTTPADPVPNAAPSRLESESTERTVTTVSKAEPTAAAAAPVLEYEQPRPEPTEVAPPPTEPDSPANR
ncbi:MAG: hypothetical protein ACXW5U_25490 [Thermoanaerobaculia bacterium]